MGFVGMVESDFIWENWIMADSGAREQMHEVGQDSYYTISYPSLGDAGTRIILLHGLAVNPRFWWQDQVDLFRHFGEVHCISLTGHYPSRLGNPGERKIDEAFLVDMIDTQLELLGIPGNEKIILVGHSTGALVSLVYGIHRPERLCGLGVISTLPQGQETEPGYAFMQRLNRGWGLPGRLVFGLILNANSLSRGIHRYLLGAVAHDRQKMFAYPGFEQWISHYLLHNKRNKYREVGAWFGDLYDIDVQDRLDQITAPVLLLYADKDPFVDSGVVPGIREKLVSAAAVQVEVIPETGHLCMFESPAAFNERITRWLGELQSVQSTEKEMSQ